MIIGGVVTGRNELDSYVYLWSRKWLSILERILYEHFQNLLTMLHGFAIGLTMRSWHDNAISPLWQCHEKCLIFV